MQLLCKIRSGSAVPFLQERAHHRIIGILLGYRKVKQTWIEETKFNREDEEHKGNLQSSYVETSEQLTYATINKGTD